MSRPSEGAVRQTGVSVVPAAHPVVYFSPFANLMSTSSSSSSDYHMSPLPGEFASNTAPLHLSVMQPQLLPSPHSISLPQIVPLRSTNAVHPPVNNIAQAGPPQQPNVPRPASNNNGRNAHQSRNRNAVQNREEKEEAKNREENKGKEEDEEEEDEEEEEQPEEDKKKRKARKKTVQKAAKFTTKERRFVLTAIKEYAKEHKKIPGQTDRKGWTEIEERRKQLCQEATEKGWREK